MAPMSDTEQATQTKQDMFDLTGRRALVTGASRGIGRAIAVAYAERGAQVLAVARSEDGLRETADLANGAAVEIHPADLRDPATIRACVERAAEQMGGIDILVNNAADDHDSPIEKTDLSVWQRVLELNLQSCWLMCQAASPHLREDGGGKVVNIASVLGLVAVRNDSAYIAAKHGLVGLTRALALEWARRNVQVNAIAPGFVETAMVAENLADEDVARWITRNTPQGRWAQPEEMAGPAIFLASRASDFMTGQVLVVDGGWTAQ
jgi:NAD(P)-dependent dehydrogenase (short-subunit alcohol dehydrogenase family)